MRKVLIAAAVMPMVVLLPGAMAASRADDDILAQLAAKATEIYAGKGYKPMGWSNQGELGEGGEKTYSLTLADGTDFSVVGMCDNGCKDLNLKLARFSGEEEASDLETDDFPIVNTQRSGLYRITVTMVKCSGTCRYSLVGFRK